MTLREQLLRAGMLDRDAQLEFNRWGVPVVDPFVGDGVLEIPAFKDAHEAVLAFQEALEDGDPLVIKETDPDALRCYLATKTEGKLYIKPEPGEQAKAATFKISYGRSTSGGYLIPWKSETISDMLTNGLSHLLVEDGASKKRVFFSSVKELWFGDQKTFMLCEALEEEEA